MAWVRYRGPAPPSTSPPWPANRAVTLSSQPHNRRTSKMGEGRFTYHRRAGVDASHGSNFEWDLTSLVYLRLEKLHEQWEKTGNSGVESFFIANSMQNVGALDDVVRSILEKSELKGKNLGDEFSKMSLSRILSEHLVLPKMSCVPELLRKSTENLEKPIAICLELNLITNLDPQNAGDEKFLTHAPKSSGTLLRSLSSPGPSPGICNVLSLMASSAPANRLNRRVPHNSKRTEK
ncbi:hypothetical protein B566_EDAN011260 [Ephemera danica]|nr:hypothetical protein B566_EDAN011260 [Ephemera danica]